MVYKLIALDLDGTLLDKTKSISEQNAKGIKAAVQAGIQVTLATGRPIRDAVGFARQLGIDGPLVVNNGGEVWKSPDTMHARHKLEPRLIASLFDLLLPYGDELDYWAHTVEGTFDRSNMPFDPANVQWLQFAIRTADAELLRSLKDRLASWKSFEISNSHPTNIECNAVGVTKESGLREVCALTGIDMSQVIAIGDSLNDIPMIRAAGLGIAMGNAQEPVKRAADIVAPSVHEDGVAKMIERFLLN